MAPTRVTDPQVEQATARIPLGGSGSVALTVARSHSGSSAGVASEKRACLPAGRAWGVRPPDG